MTDSGTVDGELARRRQRPGRCSLQPFADALEDRNRIGALFTGDHCVVEDRSTGPSNCSPLKASNVDRPVMA